MCSYLADNRISGTLSNSIGKLTLLTKMYLHLIWAASGSGFHVLSCRAISNNKLDGTLPASLGDLKEMQSLYLNKNEFTGPIPESLGQLSHLHDLSVDQNDLTGGLPDSFAGLSKLRKLCELFQECYFLVMCSFHCFDSFAANNRLSGTIPKWILNLKSLEVLDLSGNQWTFAEGASLDEAQLANLTAIRAYLQSSA